MNTHALAYCLLLITASHAHVSAATWLGGLVTDENEEPLAGVCVLLGSQTHTYTDADGYYLIEVDPGQYTIRFNYLGHDTLYANNIHLNPGCVRQMDVQLLPAPVQLGEVCIRAWKVPLIESCIMAGGVSRSSGCLQGGGRAGQYMDMTDSIAGDTPAPFRAALFPNPADTHTRLEIDAPLRAVDIFDQRGVAVRSIYEVPAGIHTIPVQDLPAGTYTIRMNRDDTTLALRLVVGHD